MKHQLIIVIICCLSTWAAAQTPGAPENFNVVPKQFIGLPDVLATVNGTAIHKLDIVPGLMTMDQVNAAVEHTIDRVLAAQQAEKEGLGTKFGSRHSSRQTSQDTRQLARQYKQNNAALTAAKKGVRITDADIDRFFEANPDPRRDPTAEAARHGVTRRVTVDLELAAYGAWLKETLAGTTIRVDGAPLSKAVLDAAIDAKTAPKLERVAGGIVVAEVLRMVGGDAGNPKDALGTVVIDVDGQELVLGELDVFARILSSVGSPHRLLPLLDVITDTALAAKARDQGLDAGSGGTSRAAVQQQYALAELFYKAHRLNRPLDGAELHGWYEPIGQALLDRSQQHPLRDYMVKVKAQYSKAPVTDAEVGGMYSVVTQSLITDRKNGVANYLRELYLGWKRSAVIEPLRAQAKIKRHMQ